MGYHGSLVYGLTGARSIVTLFCLALRPCCWTISYSRSTFSAGLTARRVLDRLVVVVLGGQLAAEDHVAGEGPANFQVDRLLRVVADPLAVEGMVVPARHGAVDLDLHARLVDSPEDARAVELHPKVVAPRCGA